MKINTGLKALLMSVIIFTSVVSSAQNKKNKKSVKSKSMAADTVKIAVKPRINHNKKIKPYASVVNKKFSTQKGLFSVHQHRDTIYFEIPDSIINRDVLVINRIKNVPADAGMHAGELLDENMIQFELGRDSTVRVRLNSTVQEAEPGSNIGKAVLTSNFKPILASFPIKAYAVDSNSYVIDVTKFLTELNFINNIRPGTEILNKVSSATPKDVAVESIRAYPLNVEIYISKNLTGKLTKAGSSNFSMETNTSLLLLPKVPMQRRFLDKRVGYFRYNTEGFSDDQQEVKSKLFISRWRLEARDQDIEKWRKGELVEPKKPIVIYIDPATPKQWIPFLIKGINDWQTPFEKAGFKNAIIGKEWPSNDTTMHLEDVRHSVLTYFASKKENAFGPHVADPRSGEILQTRIGWFHNIMNLLHRWYMVQAGAVDPKARKAKFDNELMGELVRFVSSHEVGHTLGLCHNFGSSSVTPVDSLRNLNYLKKNGHTASIMDYARFNYVAQPEDNIPQKYLFPKIGDYDNWAIEWGYKSTHADNADEDEKIVKRWATDRIKANRRLWFADGEMQFGDPRVQTEDLGDNAMKASTYGIRNLKRILPNIPKWTFEADGHYENTAKIHEEVFVQYHRYINHVLKNMGGFNRDLHIEKEQLPVFSPTSRKLHLEAMHFFEKEVFTTPFWLINSSVENLHADPTYLAKENPTNMHTIESLQVKLINTLLKDGFLHQIMSNAKRFGKNTYTLDDHFSTLHGMIWRDLKVSKVKMDSYRRNMQKSYVGSLINILTFKNIETSETDVPSYAKAELKKLRLIIKNALPKAQDKITKYHLIDLQERINKQLNAKD